MLFRSIRNKVQGLCSLVKDLAVVSDELVNGTISEFMKSVGHDLIDCNFDERLQVLWLSCELN